MTWEKQRDSLLFIAVILYAIKLVKWMFWSGLRWQHND